MTQPTLSLWAEPVSVPEDRIVARSEDRVAWLRARRGGVTATDAARLSGVRAIQSVVFEKLLGSGFGGNAYTDYGREREPHIARWVQQEHGIAGNTAQLNVAEAREAVIRWPSRAVAACAAGHGKAG